MSLEHPELGPSVDQLQEALLGEILRLNGIGGDLLGQKEWGKAKQVWRAIGELQEKHDSLTQLRDRLPQQFPDFFNPSLTTRVAEWKVLQRERFRKKNWLVQ